MLVIRREQQNVLEVTRKIALEQRLWQHVASLRPGLVEARGEAALRADIRLGIDRAVAHGFQSEYAICSWLEVALTHGNDFDALPWAASLLVPRPRTLDEGNERMAALYAEAADRVPNGA